MSREIKFRFWDALDEKMLQDIDIEEYTLHSLRDFEGELMQYTGLKDKNGKEIYEGDILEHCDGVYWEVHFEDGVFKAYRDSLRIWNTPCKIVGNIYENPELIKQ